MFVWSGGFLYRAPAPLLVQGPSRNPHVQRPSSSACTGSCPLPRYVQICSLWSADCGKRGVNIWMKCLLVSNVLTLSHLLWQFQRAREPGRLCCCKQSQGSLWHPLCTDQRTSSQWPMCSCQLPSSKISTKDIRKMLNILKVLNWFQSVLAFYGV